MLLDVSAGGEFAGVHAGCRAGCHRHLCFDYTFVVIMGIWPILGIVGEIVAIYPQNAVMQDIFFGIFCMDVGMVCLARK